MASESIDKISHKNDKLNKILLDHKKKEYRLSLAEKLKYRRYRKLFITPDELGFLVNNLFELDFLDCGTETDDLGQKIPGEPFITDDGLHAIRTNYFPSESFQKKARIAMPILTIIAILSILFGIFMVSSNVRLKDEIQQKDGIIDSLRTESKAQEMNE